MKLLLFGGLGFGGEAQKSHFKNNEKNSKGTSCFGKKILTEVTIEYTRYEVHNFS